MTEYEWLNALQEDVGEWSAEQFGTEQSPRLPYLGFGEELGELTTSVLKREQGIDDSEKYDDRIGDDAERDAVGDMVIYLLDAMYRSPQNIDLAESAAYAKENKMYVTADSAVEGVEFIYNQYGFLQQYDITEDYDDGEPSALRWDFGQLVVQIEQFCVVRGYDLRTCATEAWIEVSEREWEADIADE